MAGRAGGLSLVLLVLCLGMAVQQSDACSCIYRSFSQHYCDSYYVVRATVTEQWPFVGTHKYYKIHITTSFKGPGSAGQYRWVRTSSSSASCGSTLTVGQNYLLMGYYYGGYWNIGLCNYYKYWSAGVYPVPCSYKVSLYENTIYCAIIIGPGSITAADKK